MSALRAAVRGAGLACRAGVRHGAPFRAACPPGRGFTQRRYNWDQMGGGHKASVLRGEKNKSTPWSLLGVTRDSDDKEVKKAYIAMAKKYHPDRNDGDDTQFKKVKEAYDLIKSGEAKRLYGGGATPTPGATAGPNTSGNWAGNYGNYAGQGQPGGPTPDMQFSSSYTSYDHSGGEQTVYTYRDSQGNSYQYTEQKHGGDQNFWGAFQSAHQEALKEEAERMKARSQENREFEELFTRWAAHKINETADYRSYVKQRDEALYRFLVAWLVVFIFLRILINVFA